MATRYPLILDTDDSNKLKELPNGDKLNLDSNDIVNVVNVVGCACDSIDVESHNCW